MAEFPVAYDPCTCVLENIFSNPPKQIAPVVVDVNITKIEDLQGQLISIPKPMETSNVMKPNGTTDQFNIEGSLKPVKSFGSAIDELKGGINKVLDADTKKAMKDEIETLEKIGNFASLIPEIGGVASAVIGVIDMFSSGASSEGKGPAPVIITNNFDLKGTITTKSLNQQGAFALPGSHRSSVDTDNTNVANQPNGTVFYNEVLGNFNLLKTPMFTLRRGACQDHAHANPGCWEFDSRFSPYGDYKYDDFVLNLQEPVSYVINPALYNLAVAGGFDVSNSNIEISLEVTMPAVVPYYTGPIQANVGLHHYEAFSNWITSVTKDFGNFTFSDYLKTTNFDNDSIKVATPMYSLGCFNNSGRLFRLRLRNESFFRGENPYQGFYDLDWRRVGTPAYFNAIYSGRLHLNVKVAVKLYHAASGTYYQYINRYPAHYTFAGPGEPDCPNSDPTITNVIQPYYTNIAHMTTDPDTYGLPEGEELTSSLVVDQQMLDANPARNVFMARDNITVSGNIAANRPIKLYAATLEVHPDAQIEGPDFELIPYNFMRCTLPLPQPATPSQIHSVCYDDKYKTNTERVGRMGDENLVTTPKEDRPFRIFPNPTLLTSQIQAVGPASATFTLTNAIGQSFPLFVTGSDGNYKLQHSATVPGVYILTITTFKGNQNQRLILQ